MGEARGRRAGAALGVEAEVPADPAGAEAEDVALAQLDALRGRGGIEQLGQDLERRVGVDRCPGAGGVTRDVEEHAAADDALARGGVDAQAAGADVVFAVAVVEGALGAEVADRIPLRGALRPVVVELVVHHPGHERDHGVLERLRGRRTAATAGRGAGRR